ncbi:aminoacyl-tRNA hydrolase [Aestuariivirga litoralis]|uniref:aminoacyl-tRNA hydrolase n=1 Tax=Aestuariivirga litoralis TaxID=2650924 RepID=UPI0018C773FD|nr:aminoacyl-tRNA hydrolase [Aestuariivirga litoralis]
MFLFVGLGNPGAQYASNRHNIGFMAADVIHSRHHFSPWRKKFKGELSDGTLAGEKVLLLKPQTFMNESGRSVGEAQRFHDIPLTNIYVFYDELDLEPGKVRVRLGGGAAGHNGIRSISNHITPDFKRVRLGIGHPGDKRFVQPHVLGNFAKDDKDWLVKVLDTVADEAAMLAEGLDEKFQSKVAMIVNPPRPNGVRVE